MAENSDGQEKSEQPTGKKLSDARKKGQVPRSRELNTVAVTLGGVVLLFSFGQRYADQMMATMRANFSVRRDDIFDPVTMLDHLTRGIQDALWLLAPFFIAMVVIAVLSSIVLGGMSFSMESLTPKFGKLNPVKGFKRMFALKGLLELLKSVLKFLLIGGVTVLVLWADADEFLHLGSGDVRIAIAGVFSLLGWATLLLASTLLVLAAIDVPFQLWEHTRNLRMTKQEVRDEMKNTEGRPEVKGRIRQVQRELAQRRMMDEVPKADVIVTNPTHYAVALSYQPGMAAPKVVAKGVGLVAANIRELGGKHRVPIVEAPPLARAIYFNTEIGEQIPAGLYLAVAKLLGYIFQLQAWRVEGGEYPRKPDDFPVPDELRR